MTTPARSNRFSLPQTVELELLDSSATDRVRAVGELMRALNGHQDIDAHAVFEAGTVSIQVERGVQAELWEVVFHLVWPDPALSSPAFATVKLMNWSATCKVDFAAAKSARESGLKRLLSCIETAVGETGRLRARARLLLSTED